ncbi:RCC1 domain-containing protein [Flavobacterium pallidum]|nr:fibronectin type III domain-containing protein [Flavobacterium pallidum]
MRTKITSFLLFTLLFISTSYSQCWQSVTAGYESSAAIKPDGTLWTWGWNGFGQLGLGNTTNVTTPVKVGSATWKMVSMGTESTSSAYAMAIQTNGTLWAWGGNGQGELGIGNTVQQNSPVQVGTATNWKYVYAGLNHTVAIKTDGTMWAWGRNIYGQLGDGTNTNRLSPVQVGTATNWKMAALGGSNTFALKTDGTIWACGDNAGYYGNGTTTNSNIPVQIGTATDWQSISRTMGTILAIKTDGTLWGWGDNNYGELGIGSTATVSYTPVQVGTATWTSVYAAWGSSFGIKTDGTLWAWGDNTKGQLGDNTTVNKLSPVQVGTTNNWASMGTGLTYTFGIKTDGSMFAWGANQMSQLGLGNTTEYHVPTTINCTGCATAAEGLYPTATFTPACTGSQETITADAWAGEYSNVNVVANRSYTFNSSVTTDYVTITNAAGSTIYISGSVPLTWFCATSGTIRYVLNTNASCGTQQTSRTRYITCNDVSCTTPVTALTANNIASNSATISWTAPSPAPPLGYEYFYSDVNATPGANPSGLGGVGAGVLTKTLTGLTTGVRYYYWVRTKCTSTIKGSWVSGGSFVPTENPPCLNGTQYPSTNYTPTCSGSQETIVTNAWAGEYTLVNVLANKVYTFKSSVATDYITIASTDGLTIYATGVSPVVWTSNAVAGTIKYFFHTGSGCGTLQTSRIKYITCADPCNNDPSNLAAGNVYATSATLSWTAPVVAPGLDYQYYVSTSTTAPTANTSPTGSVNATLTSVALNNLSVTTTYNYWVRSRCSATSVGNWIPGTAFTTTGCNAPANINVSNITAGSATLSWTAPASLPEFGYEYYYSTTNVAPVAGTSPSGSISSGGTIAALDLLPDSTYYVWMRSRCGGSVYGSWVSAGSFTSLSCNPPTDVSIRSVYEGFLVVQFVRPAVVPEGYDYYVSTAATEPTASTPKSGIFYMSSVDEGYIFDLLPDTTYYVWMRSNCGNVSKGAWISAGSATTLSCMPPTGVSVANVFSSTAELSFQGPSIAQYYYNTTGVAPDTSTQYSGLAFQNPYTITGLTPSTTYYLWVRTYCDTYAYSDWIAVAPFTTEEGREVMGTFVNNTTGSTTSFNQSDSVTFTFGLATPAYWAGSGNLYVWAYSSDMAQGNFQPSPNNGAFDAPLPASTLTLNPNGTYSITLNPVSSYFSNQPYIGRLDFIVKNASGSKFSAPNYAVLVNPVPAPTALNQLFCSHATVADLVATGQNIKWFTSGAGGTSLALSTPLTTGAYYASQTINGNESLGRAMITVTVNEVSLSPDSATLCGDMIQPLTVTAANTTIVLKIGTETQSNVNYTPYQGYWGGARSQAIYTAAELGAIGLQAGSPINSIGYKLQSGTPIQLSNFTVKAGFTTASLLPGYIESPAYTVFTDATYVPATAVGNVDYILSTPLIWDGTSNLLVETCYNNNNNGGTAANNLSVESSSISTQLYKHRKIDNEPSICTITSTAEMTLRPNLRLGTTFTPIISWSPANGLYSDASATIPYTGESLKVVYVKTTTPSSYNVNVTTAGCTATFTATIDAHFTPAPESGKQYFCSGATVANLVATGSNIKWYDAENNVLNSSALLHTSVYYVTQTAHGCESTKAAVSVIINDTPAPEVAAQSFCSEATVADLVATGTGLQWFDNANHVLALTEIIHTGIYYVSQTGHGCESPKAAFAVTVNVTAAPVAENQVFCNAAIVADLAAAGDNIKWYDASNHILNASDALQSGIYFATQTQNNCESDRTMITVTVNTTPAPVVENQTFCGAALVSDLIASGSDLRWYDAENNVLAANHNLSTGTYYVSQTAHDCESEKTEVTVTVNITVAPVTSAQTFCSGATVADLIATGNDIKWYDNNHMLLSGNTLLVTGTYYVSQTAHACESEMTAAVIMVNPNTTTSEMVTACDSYTWNGQSYTQSGDYTHTSTNASGCTHIANLHLTINHSTTISETVTACGSYAWYGTTYTASGDYTHTGTNSSGCTETATLHLTVNHTPAPTASSQSFCSGSIANLTAAGTNIKWYGTASGGTALSTDTALEQGTYYATQTINGCESPRTSVSVTIQVAMPSAPSPQTFLCGARRTNLSATGTTLRWYTTATGGTAMASADLLATGTYYVTQTIDGCQSSRRAVEVIINTIAPPTANDQTYCYNGTVANLMATGTDIRWYATATGGTALATTTTLTAGTYYASQKTGTCESPRTPINVTLSGPALPDAASPQTYNCGARRTSLTATGTGLKWYTTATGGTAMLSSTQLVAGSYYVSQTIDGCEGARREVQVTITYPTPPTASTQVFCTAATVANLYATGTGVKWYATDTDTTPLASSTPLSSGTYYASQTNSMVCESTRTAVQVITGGAPMPDAPSPQSFVCGTKRPALTATGSSLLWYTVPTAGTALSSTAVLVTGTYYVSQTLNGCESTRRSVSVTITNPAAPSASAQTLCSGSTVANLTANGTGLKWYSTPTGGTALASTAQVTAGTYYVSQGSGSCESERTAVSVAINTIAMPDAPSPQVFSCNVKRPALTAMGTSLLWYTVATGGTALSSTAQLATGTYYVSQTVDGCTSARRAVSVTVNATAPPAVSDQSLCQGKLVSDLTATGTALRWYAASSGGTPLAPSVQLTAATYYVTQTINGCESLRAASNVTLMPCAVRMPETAKDDTTSNEDIASAYHIRIFPNPTASVINIKSDGDFKVERVVILDSAGRVVLEQSGADQVDVSRFARGVYILQAFSGEQRYQAKFIKE